MNEVQLYVSPPVPIRPRPSAFISLDPSILEFSVLKLYHQVVNSILYRDMFPYVFVVILAYNNNFVIVNLAWGQFCYRFFYVIKHIKNREGKLFGHDWGPSSVPISLIVTFKYLLTKTCKLIIIVFLFFSCAY